MASGPWSSTHHQLPWTMERRHCHVGRHATWVTKCVEDVNPDCGCDLAKLVYVRLCHHCRAVACLPGESGIAGNKGLKDANVQPAVYER